MDFTNEQIKPEDIPSVQNIEFSGLDQNYLTVELIAKGLFWLVLGIGAIVFIYINVWDIAQWQQYALFIFLIIWMVISFALTVFGFRKKKYALRERDIIYQSGLIWRNFTVLPFNRVQHAEVQQGPIDRIFELSRLKIYTAGGSSSDLVIAGLPLERAQNLKHFILHQTSGNEEE